MPALLITRPEEEAAALAAAVGALGWDPVIEPLLAVGYLDRPLPDLGRYQALLFTSANGVRALARLTQERQLPVLAVGDATARTALAAGFSAVESAHGTVEDLARLAILHCRADRGPLLHAAGTARAGDLSALLAASGLTVDRTVLYQVETATAFSPDTASALRQGRIAAAALFSPRTARTFATLIADGGFGAAAEAMVLYCLSEAVAKAAAALPLAWRGFRTAPAPTMDALLALLAEDGPEQTGKPVKP